MNPAAARLLLADQQQRRKTAKAGIVNRK